MHEVFCNCISLTTLDISNFDTSRTQIMEKMFYNCSSLQFLNLSSFNNLIVYNMISMFSDCIHLKYINLKNSHGESLQTIENIFKNTPEKMIFCVDETKNQKVYNEIISSKPNSVINCSDDLVFDFLTETTIPIIQTTTFSKIISTTTSYISTTIPITTSITIPKSTQMTILNTFEKSTDLENINDTLNIGHEINQCLNNISFSQCILDNFENITNNNQIYDIIVKYILPSFSSENTLNQVIEGKNYIVYQISNSKIQFGLVNNKSTDNNNLSFIDLDICENILKQEYNIDEEEHLIVLIYENTSSVKSSERNVTFEIFEPYNITKLNLSLCYNTTIKLYVKTELSEETKQIYEQMKEYGYDMFDINDPFYQDTCTPYTTLNDTDILLSDRIDYIYNNKDTKCQANCQFSGYSIKSKYMLCNCSVNGNNSENKKDKFFTKKIYESFYDVLKYSNYKIYNCYKLVFNRKMISKNIGGYIIFVYYLVHLVCLVIFIVIKDNPLKLELMKFNKDKIKNGNINNMTNNKIKRYKKNIQIF